MKQDLSRMVDLVNESTEIYMKFEVARAMLEAFRDKFATSDNIEDDILTIRSASNQYEYLLYGISEVMFEATKRLERLGNDIDHVHIALSKKIREVA